jgi:hypothetical protein
MGVTHYDPKTDPKSIWAPPRYVWAPPEHDLAWAKEQLKKTWQCNVLPATVFFPKKFSCCS